MVPFADAVALGDCEVVLAAPRPEAEPEATAVALAVARCRRSAGDRVGALAELQGRAGPLGGYVALERAEAHVGTSLVVQDLEGVSLPGEAGLRVRLLRATAARDVEGLLGLQDTAVGAGARLAAARILREQGATTRAVEVARRAFLDARPGGDDARAATLLQELGVEPLGLASSADRTFVASRLKALQEANRAEEALVVAERLAADAPPTDAAGWIALGRARYAARSYAAANEAWAHVVGPPAEAVGNPQLLFDVALCYARADDYDTAAVVYRRLMAQHPTSSQAEFASFKLGYMHQDRGDCAAAVPELREHRERYPSSKHEDEAFWFEARCAWRTGDREAAVAVFGELLEAVPGSSLAPGAVYWRSRAAEGDAERAGLARVVKDWPVSAYAWLAAERLGRSFPSKPLAPAPAWTAALAANPAVRRAEALLAAGLDGWALAELAGVPKPADRAGALALADARLRGGDAKGAQKLACAHAPKPWVAGDEAAKQLCWPRVEGALVDDAGGPVPEALIFGVMTAESAMDPSVSSAVGARGLMQLMPEVGERLHRSRWPERPFDPDRLYSAPYNVVLGSSELAERAGSLDGLLTPSSWPAVVASYNGGEEAVRRWAGDTTESDEWTEVIGYTETRGYVKRVLGFAMAWRWVWGDAPP